MKTSHAIDHFVFEELEKRILYSADIGVLAPALPGVATAALELPQYQSPVLPAAQAAAASSAEQESKPRHEAVFIDGAVDGAHELADELVARQDPQRILDVYVLDPSRDGVAQISQFLGQQHDLDAIHIISHGNDGLLQLGSTQLDSNSLRTNALAISAWGAALTSQGDILLYGCDVAQTAQGQQFVDTIGQLTGADIAASNDLTGSAARGGDWNLEYSRGSIETAIAPDASMQLSYSGILATYTVTTTADSGAGSLRQAILDANSNAGTDSINFAIGSGAKSIAVLSALPTITDVTYLDATTQAGYSNAPLIELNGAGSGGADGLTISGSGATGSRIAGFVINRFSNGISVDGANSVQITGNYIGTNAAGTNASANSSDGILLANTTATAIGGASAAQRNVISGNTHNGINSTSTSTGNSATGNYIGTNASGTAAIANGYNGISITGIYFTVTSNVISGNTQSGINVNGVSNTLITGNYIGTNAGGTAALQNGQDGIAMTGNNSNNTIGGSTAATRNVISGNHNDGVSYSAGSVNNDFLGNYVGVNATGTGVIANGRAGVLTAGTNTNIGSATAGSGNIISGNTSDGINTTGSNGTKIYNNLIGVGANGVVAFGNGGSGVNITSGAQNTVIGGTSAGLANVIANNQQNGITVTTSGGNGNTFEGNAIYNNLLLGIDLGSAGVTANDPGDVDTGANRLQNFPVLASSTSVGATTVITGTFNSTASATYRLEFFASVTIDGSNYGEAERYLGFVNVTTDSSGNASFSATLSASTSGGDWISATATNQSTGDTSEFALSIQNVGSNAPPVGTAHTITTKEDTAYVLLVSDFGFTDPNDSPPNNFLAVVLTTVPASGTLHLNGVTVGAGATVQKTDISAGKLIYTPLANAKGNNAASFTFQVQDDGGGTDTDATARLMTINITSVNDAPVGTSKTLNIYENAPYTFTRADFGFSDPNDSPANAFDRVYLTSAPASGTIYWGSSAEGVGDYITADDIDLGLMVYRPAANVNGTVSFNFRVQDDGGTANGGVNQDVTARTMTINLAPVNSAPAGTARTVTLNEDTSYVFVATDFGFTDPNDVPANSLLSVTISTVPASGSLRLNGTALANGASVLKTDIDAGKLLYVPVANGNGGGLGNFTFRVRDNGGTANGGVDTDPTARLMTVNVNAVSDAPVGTPKTVTVVINGAYTFSAADFGFTDPSDTPADSFVSVTLTTVPTAGTLRNTRTNTLLADGAVVLKSDLDGGHLVYAPASNDSTTRSFSFQVGDSGSTANGGANLDGTARVMTINVSLNHAPAGTPATVTTLEDQPYTFTLADFGFSDPADAGANQLAAVIVTTIPASGSLSDNGVTLSAGMSVSRADIIAGLLLYQPAANVNGAAAAGFTFQVRDDGGTAGGGSDTDPVARQMTIDITSVNDAPVGTPFAVTMQEDSSYSFDFNDFGFSDPDDSPANNIGGVLISVDPAQGSTSFVGGKIVFTPAANFFGTATMNFRVVDDGGTANGGVNADLQWRAVTITVTPVNDAPVLSGSAAPLAYVENGAPAPVLPTLVVNDIDNTTLAHATVSISGGPADGQDVLAFTNTGATAMGNISATYDAATQVLSLVSAGSSATLAQWQAALRAVTYANNSDNPATVARSISFTVSDGALDSNPVVRTVNVTAVNDAPVLANSGGVTAYSENGPFIAVDPALTLNDADNSTLASATLSISNNFRAGDQLRFVNDGVSMGNIVHGYNNLTGVMTLTSAGATATVAQWQAALRSIAYRSTSDDPGSNDRSITFTVNDGAVNSSGSVKIVRVTGINDAPVLNGVAAAAQYLENAAPVVIDASLTVNDVDNSTLSGARVSIGAGFAVGQDVLMFANTGAAAMGNISAAWNTVTGVLTLSSAGSSATLAQWQTALRAVKYANTSDSPDSAIRSISFVVNDGNLDSAARTITLAVVPVNDAPVGSDHAVVTQENQPYTFVLADFGFTDPLDTSIDSPGNTLAAVLVTALPSQGQLTLYGAQLSAGMLLAASDIAAGGLVYTPVAGAHGAALASYDFKVRDNGGTANGGVDTDTVARTITISVTAFNRAPVGTANTVSTLENAPYTFLAADFGFTDPAEAPAGNPANQLLQVLIDTLPQAGTLTRYGVAIAAGSLIDRHDIDAGALVYTPVLNANGPAVASFSFRVRDDGGTAGAGLDTDGTARLMTVAVTPVNNAPTGAPHTVSLKDDGSYTFKVADFGFSDEADALGGIAGDNGAAGSAGGAAIAGANRLLSVFISTIPGSGTLSLYGVALGAGSTVLAADIESGGLVYKPVTIGGPTLLLGFAFQVRDDGGVERGGVDLDATARLMTLEISNSLIGNPATVVTSSGQLASAAALDNPNAVDNSADDSSAKRAANAGRGDGSGASGAGQRVDIPISPAGSRQLAIELDAGVIKANIARFLNARIDTYQAPAASGFAVPVSASVQEAADAYHDTVLVQTTAVRHEGMLDMKKISSSDTGVVVGPPNFKSNEEEHKDYDAARAIAHKIQAAVAVSALGTIWVVARKAALVASLVSSVPAWMRLDPLPILASDDEPEEDLALNDSEEAAQSEAVEHLFNIEGKTPSEG